MTKSIELLDNNTINNIAAGEVVDRPLSVVKELIDNGIDAKATNIKIEIKNGGISYINVTDNGFGILREQLQLSFQRHTTSKIKNINDLENIMTLGFRGEALSSILSVSQAEIITKTENDLFGILLEVEQGEIIKETTIEAPYGCSFTIRNLFYNIPARRKFLKKDSVEASYISDAVINFCLSNMGIGFKYINNGNLILNIFPDDDLRTRIFKIYGSEIENNLIPINYNKNNINLSGFLGNPTICRNNRNYEVFFINKRYIKNKLVQSAVEEAFKGRLPISKFPFFVINMGISQNLIDINVHPAKLEVKFQDDNAIYNIILEGINNCLNNEILIPKIKFKKEQNLIDVDSYQKSIYDVDENLQIKRLGKNCVFGEKTQKENIINQPNITSNALPLSSVINESKTDITAIKKGKTKKPFFFNYVIKGQLFNTYWIIEQDKSIYLIDQHAAHEKYFYEKIYKSLTSENTLSQTLLIPVVFKLNDFEFVTLKDNIELLNNIGFSIEYFMDNTCALKGVPFTVKGNIDSNFLITILDKLGNAHKNITNIYEMKTDLIASMACKAAVKANDILSYSEARMLIENLLKLENPFNCPHGRPTIIEISKNELEKKFKRT